MTTSANPNDIFHFLRGAIRGYFGVENFRDLTIAVAGENEAAMCLLTMLCLDGVDLYYATESLILYDRSHMICGGVNYLHRSGTNECDVNVFICLDDGIADPGERSGYLVVGCKDRQAKEFDLSNIDPTNPYEQGIHAFYL